MTVAITLGVVAGAGFAVQQGASFLSQRAEAVPPPPEAGLLSVETRAVAMQAGYSAPRRFLGQIEANESSALSFEFGGRITEILVDEGDRVSEGDEIARLDTSLLETEVAQLRAARDALTADLEFARRTLARREALQERGFSPEEALDQARFGADGLAAHIAETDARIAAVEVRLQKSVLRAPFDGQVATRSPDTGATVGGGQHVLTLLQDGAPRLRVGLPAWVEAKPGTDWQVEIAGRTHSATLVALRPDIDPATRTRAALFEVAADAPFGTTASVIVPRQVEAAGAWIPTEALREGAPGVWTVLVVDETDTVRAAPVEVLHAEADRLYVAGGLHAGLSLITGGPQRAVPGQKVAPILADQIAEN